MPHRVGSLQLLRLDARELCTGRSSASNARTSPLRGWSAVPQTEGLPDVGRCGARVISSHRRSPATQDSLLVTRRIRHGIASASRSSRSRRRAPAGCGRSPGSRRVHTAARSREGLAAVPLVVRCSYGSSRRLSKIFCLLGGLECVVELAGDVALQAADDLGLGQPFAGASGGVGAGAGVVAQAS